jgi:Dockerin type I domain
MNVSHVQSVWLRLLVCSLRTLLVGACLLIPATFDRLAAGATLEELFRGESIIVGNSQFSDWELISLDSTAAVSPDLSQIAVVPLADDASNPGLQFVPNGQLSISGINSIDFLFKFHVHALTGSEAITNHALALTGISFDGNGGLANISADAMDDLGADLGPTLVIADKESKFTQSFDASGFAPQLGVFVVTEVFINGLSAADAINLASFSQSFSQTGPVVLAGDVNLDGLVDIFDINLVSSHWGTAGPAGDANGDGVVNIFDINLISANWNPGGGAGNAAAVPEPTTLILTFFALVGIVFLHRNLRRAPRGSHERETCQASVSVVT